MKFRTLFDGHPSMPNCCGSRTRQCYKRTVNAFGVSTLEKAGVDDQYRLIQEASKGILVNDLVKRYLRGDKTAIPDVVSSYGDFTKAPQNLMEASNTIVKAREHFDSLPADTKAKFGNSVENYLSTVTNPEKLDSFAKSVNAKKTQTPSLKDELFNVLSKFGGLNNADT